MNEEIEALRTQVEVLSQVVTQVIAQMAPIDAARAAAGLAMEHQLSEQEHGQSVDRSQLVGAYLGLLGAVAQRA